MNAEQSTFDRLRKLDAECRQMCVTTGGDGTEYKLLYSAANTFERTNQLMILGKNPGGEAPEGEAAIAADSYLKSVWMDSPHSAYVDERWWDKNGRLLDSGSHRMQQNIQKLGHRLLGGRGSAEAFLRSVPAGNLWPFRSRLSPLLSRERKLKGWGISEKLVEIANPTTLVLICSDVGSWARVMSWFGHGDEPDYREAVQGAGHHRDYLEAAISKKTIRTKLVVALPAFNNKNTDPEPALRVLDRRIREGHVPVLKHGQS